MALIVGKIVIVGHSDRENFRQLRHALAARIESWPKCERIAVAVCGDVQVVVQPLQQMVARWMLHHQMASRRDVDAVVGTLEYSICGLVDVGWRSGRSLFGH